MQAIWLFFLPIIFAASASAIHCYTCESVYETRCGEQNFKSQSYWKLDCSRVAAPRYFLQVSESLRNATACVKKIYEVAGERRVERSCFFGDSNNTELGCKPDPAMMDIKEVACLVCDDENYCNTAPGAWSPKRRDTGILFGITLLAMCFFTSKCFI